MSLSNKSFNFRVPTNLLKVGVMITGFVLSSDAMANRFGIFGTTNSTGSNGMTCAQSGCHSGSDYNSSLEFQGETTVTPGSTNDISLVLSFTPPSGVNSPIAGFQAELSDSNSSFIAGTSQQISNGRLTHSLPTDTDGQSATFSFQWQAPENEGSVTFYACAQPADNNFLNSGDDSNPACIEQVLTVADEQVVTPVDPVDPVDFVEFDYDGDGYADVGVRRPSNQLQYISNSSDGETQRVQFGRNTADIPVSGDFDGDGVADVAVRRPSNFFWYIKRSSDDETQGIQFGRNAEDIPVPADYDGDGITDVAVRRASTQFWFIQNSSGVDAISGNEDGITRLRFGTQEGDIPVVADYDGDGKADIAVRRPGNFFWYIRNSSGVDEISDNDDGITRLAFGRNEADIPVPADYDGDGKADIAVRRPSNFTWYIRNSNGVDLYNQADDGLSRVIFGKNSEDVPIPADYDGDGKVDLAVRRPSNFFQFILRSSDNLLERIQFGRQTTDVPLAAPVLQRMSMVEAANLSARPASIAFEEEWADSDLLFEELD